MKRTDARAPEAVLVFRIGSLGDTVISLPAMHVIRRRHPGARILLLTNTPVDGGLKAASSTQILTGAGLVDEYIEYPHGSVSPERILGVIREIRRHGPTLCYFLMPQRSRAQGWRDWVFLKIAGLRTIVGLNPARFATRPPAPGATLWEGEAARLLRAVGDEHHPPSLRDYALSLSEAETTFAADALQGAGVHAKIIVMSVGAKIPVKDWGDDNWNRFLADLGSTSADHALVAIGAQVEWARSAQLLARWPGTAANLCGQLTPRQSAAVLAQSRVFVGHDSGPMHLASAVGTPAVAVFSSRNMPGIWFPKGSDRDVFYSDVDCRGCGLDICLERNQRCIRDIAPGPVAERVRSILDGADLARERPASPEALASGVAYTRHPMKPAEATRGKVFFFESHPVQYKAPVYQALNALLPDAFEVIYATDASVRAGNIDPGFGAEVVWDVPLLSGYQNRVLHNERGEPMTTPASLSGRGIFALLRRERPRAVVLTHFRYRFDQAAYLSALVLGIPVLVRQETQDEMPLRPRSWLKNLIRSTTYRALYRPAKLAFAFGDLNLRHLRRHGLANERIVFARFSVPDPFAAMSHAQKVETRRIVRCDVGAADDRVVVGFFGKFIPKKSPALIFSALAHLPDAVRSRLHLVFIGSGELQQVLDEKAAEARTQFGVTTSFMGFINQSRLPGYYLATDIAVLASSYEETWGLVVNEALHSGCAVAITKAVGCQREFSGMSRVRVVETGNAAQLADALAELSVFVRDFDWAVEPMRRYSTEAAAHGLARGIGRFLR